MEEQSEQDSLSGRRQELIDRADERNIDWEPAIQELPQDDDKRVISVLTTLLGISFEDALDTSKPLDELEREAELRDREEQRWQQLRFSEEARRALGG